METKENIAYANIQTELNRLWEAQPGSSKGKACLFNLIVYTPEARRAEYFKGIISLIMEQFPCRIIFIQSNPASQNSYLRVHVSTETGKDKKGIACDQIFIEAAGEDLKRVPFLILPLFSPDLPIYLLWGQDPTTDSLILPHLQSYARRLIFDSECIAHLRDFNQIIQELQALPIPMIDMNWARIGGWREVIAQTFDSQERFEQLASAQFIKIVYNDLASPYFTHRDTQALYLQAWLGSRLNWEFVRMETQDDRLLLHYKEREKPVQVHLVAANKQDFLSADIIEIEISNQGNYVCNLMRRGENQVMVHASNEYQCELPFTLFLPTLRSGRSFMQEIFYQKISSQYFDMLQLISQIQWR